VAYFRATLHTLYASIWTSSQRRSSCSRYDRLAR